jgi:hypothetical protein
VYGIFLALKGRKTLTQGYTLSWTIQVHIKPWKGEITVPDCGNGEQLICSFDRINKINKFFSRSVWYFFSPERAKDTNSGCKPWVEQYKFILSPGRAKQRCWIAEMELKWYALLTGLTRLTSFFCRSVWYFSALEGRNNGSGLQKWSSTDMLFWQD